MRICDGTLSRYQHELPVCDNVSKFGSKKFQRFVCLLLRVFLALCLRYFIYSFTSQLGLIIAAHYYASGSEFVFFIADMRAQFTFQLRRRYSVTTWNPSVSTFGPNYEHVHRDSSSLTQNVRISRTSCSKVMK